MFEHTKTACIVPPSLTGWDCTTPSGVTHHTTRSEAQTTAKAYDAERRALIQAFDKQHARIAFEQD